MTAAAQPKIDWLYEYRNHTELWEEQCYRRWEKARQLLLMGYKIVPIRILDKATLPRKDNRGIHNPYETETQLLHDVADPTKKYFDFNYGIVTGIKTCVVVDLEGHTDPTGETSLLAFEVDHSFQIPRDIQVRTPNGGLHLYCAWNSEILSAARPFGKNIGIDVLSSRDMISTRHVVGPESVTVDGKYEEVPDRPMQPVSALARLVIPDEFVTLVNQAVGGVGPLANVTPITGKGRGNEEVNQEDVLPRVPLAEIVEMLTFIDCSKTPYDDWLKIGMAVHRESKKGLETDGFGIWNEWSRTDTNPGRYDHKVCQAKWATFGADVDNPVTIGTVINMAMQNGYKPPVQHMAVSVLERIQQETPNVFLGGKCYFVRVTDEGEVQEMAREDAKAWYEGEQVFANGKWHNPIDLFMRWKGRVRYDKYELQPPPCPPRLTTLNIWRGWRIDPIKNASPDRFLELFKFMFPEEATREWAHDWFAHMLQYPGTKPHAALVMSGPQGTGKNTLLDVFRKMLRRYNSQHFISSEHFTSRFNKRLVTSVLVIVNEAVWSGNHKHASMLKGYVSEEEFEVEEKNVKRFQARNCARIVILSNEDWVVPADGEGRRYCVNTVPKIRPTGDVWWKSMKEYLNDETNIAQIMGWYMERKITHNLNQVPQNDALATQRRITVQRMDGGKYHQDELNTLLRVMANGKAVFREGESEGKKYKGYMVSTSMMERAYMATHPNKPISPLLSVKVMDFIEQKLGMQRPLKTRAKYKGEPKMIVVMPPLKDLKKAMAKFTVRDLTEIDGPDEWTEEGIMW